MNLGSMQRGIFRGGGILGQPVSSGPGAPSDFASAALFSGRDINFIQGQNLIGQFLLGNTGDQGVQGHTLLVPADLSGTTWESHYATTISLASVSGSLPVVSSDGLYAYQAVEGDGTVGSNGRVILIRWDMSDGSIDYAVECNEGGQGTADGAFHVTLDEVADRVWVHTGASGDEIQEFVASTGAGAGRSCNDGGLGSICAFSLSPNGDYLIAAGDSEYAAQWLLSGVSGLGNLFDGYSTDRLNFGVGGDTTLETTTIQRNVGGAKMVQARDGTNRVWFCAGDSTGDDPFIYCYDPTITPYSSRAAIEVDVSALMDYTDTGTAHVRDLAIDNTGRIYALILPGTSGVNYDVVRLRPNGTFDLSFKAAGVSIMDFATYGHARRVAVTEDYKVMVGTDSGADGYAIVYAQ